MGGGWVAEDRLRCRQPARCRVVEDELAARVGDERQISEEENLAGSVGIDRLNLARQVGDEVHRAEDEDLARSKDVGVDVRSHLDLGSD